MASAARVDLAALVDAEPTPCAVLSPELRIQRANAAYSRLLGREACELVGQPISQALADAPGAADSTGEGPFAAGMRLLVASLERVRASGRTDGLHVVRHDVRDDQGQTSPRFLTPVNVPFRGSDGALTAILQRVEDVTDQVTIGTREITLPEDHQLHAAANASPSELVGRVHALHESMTVLRLERDELAAKALRDPLTGALSRSVFYEELTRALARIARRPHPLAVLFVDLDRLKQVNDAHGHAAGDELIRCGAERITRSVRPSDAVARLGGDEFVILLDELGSAHEAQTVASRVLTALAEPCSVSPGVLVNPSASIGIAVADNASVSADTLLSHADAAMYKAKQSGRGRYELFDAAAYHAATIRVQLEQELRRALERDQLTLHYQPIYDLTTGSACAVEALLRWEHPTRGLLAADEFIDVAQDSGLLVHVGPWVVSEACRQLARWDRALGEQAPRRVFLNLSVTELVQPGLHTRISASAALCGVAPDRLVIEVTESGVLDKPESVSAALDDLLALGCGIAIDDFGTGYSALSRLVELPADILKIDRSFVRALSHGQEAAAVIAAVLLLAHNLRKTVVAEGVEDADALATLAELGCEHAQGYHLGRPQPADAITQQFRAPALTLR